MFGYVHLLEEAGLSMNDYPAIERWVDAVSHTDRFRPLAELGSGSQ